MMTNGADGGMMAIHPPGLCSSIVPHQLIKRALHQEHHFLKRVVTFIHQHQVTGSERLTAASTLSVSHALMCVSVCV